MTTPNVRSKKLGDPGSLPVVIWRDIFVLLDSGTLRVPDYALLERMALAQAYRHPFGLGCLIVLPATAKPPPEEVRKTIAGVLNRTTASIRCMCWLVLGSGFRAATVRAALSGLRMLSQTPYPTHVSATAGEALQWILEHLENGKERSSEVESIMAEIDSARLSLWP